MTAFYEVWDIPINYDQFNNSQFDCLAIYRDVELYHFLYCRGYRSITAISMSEARGTLLIQQKLVYATSGNKSVLVQVRMEGETFPIDQTTVVSRDGDLLSELRVVLDLVKTGTSYAAYEQNPEPPFRVLQSSS